MDYQNRHASKPGAGGPASAQQMEIERREHLKRLAMEMVDLDKDPYMLRNHVGRIECRLCLTIHPNESNYLSHTQGKRHQANLAKRRAMEAASQSTSALAPSDAASKAATRTIKIGRPAYKVLKSQDPTSGQWCLQFEIMYPEIERGLQPRHRFMSAYEQRVEAPDKAWQYLVFAAAPYANIGFKIPARPVDKGQGKFLSQWDESSKTFTVTLHLMTPTE